MTAQYADRLRKVDWEVRPVGLLQAKELVRTLHYAKGGSKTATIVHGLFYKGAFWDAECCGVAWWIPPTRTCASATFPENPDGVLALSRLVISPNTPKNACTFLLARSVRLIPVDRWPCLVTYADTWRGHTGTIYHAAGWKYLGLTEPEATYTVRGMMKARKAGDRTRTHQQMLSECGATFEGKHAKHKFVLIR